MAYPGYKDDKKEILNQLRRVEGQIRGIQKMVEQETYCIDVLTQITAAEKGLKKVAVSLVEDHLDHCVADAVAGGKSSARAKVREASAAIARLVRS
jgi:DNA-binding FrmR family transcriptional regulator